MSTQSAHQHHSHAAHRTSELTYYVFEGVLAGTLNGQTISISAVSGGGGGSKTKAPNETMNNPYMYGLKEVKGPGGNRGGPIPLGDFKISSPAHNGHLGLSAALSPQTPMPKSSRRLLHPWKRPTRQ